MSDNQELRNRKGEQIETIEETKEVPVDDELENKEIKEEKKDIKEVKPEEEPSTEDELPANKDEPEEEDDEEYEEVSGSVILIRFIMLLTVVISFAIIFFKIKKDFIDAGPDEGFLYAQLVSRFCKEECTEEQSSMIERIMTNYRANKN
ncbi:hypothetical protein WA158_001591 [Blastocystis sp. Blastoise]